MGSPERTLPLLIPALTLEKKLTNLLKPPAAQAARANIAGIFIARRREFWAPAGYRKISMLGGLLAGADVTRDVENGLLLPGSG